MEDDELVTIARQAIGEHYGLTADQARRLHGDTAAELREDAKLMRSELGLPPLDERERDGRGRFAANMNAIIRARAGRA